LGEGNVRGRVVKNKFYFRGRAEAGGPGANGWDYW